MAKIKGQLEDAQLQNKSADPTLGVDGKIWLNTSTSKAKIDIGSAAKEIITHDQTQTLTNKTVVVASNTITTAASGNLAATELNTALAELQTDIDSRAVASDLTNHIADTSTHGVSGDVVGTTDSQVLTNKKIGLDDGASGAGNLALYFDDDTNTGLYSSAADAINVEAGGFQALEVKKSTGNYANLGVGGASASASDSYPVLIERTVAGSLVSQISNPSSDATASAKIQLSVDAGDKLGELAVYPNEATTDAYSSRFVVRPNGNSAGLSLIGGDLSTGNIKFYTAGDYASTGEAFRVNEDKTVQFPTFASSVVAPSAGVKLYAKSDGKLYKIAAAGSEVEVGSGTSATASQTCNGRLTLTTGVPVTTSDVTAATTIYFTPYGGNRVALYNGASWDVYAFTQRSLSVPATTSTMYDVFLYDNAGTLTLEAVAWTNDTTRATALVIQDGVYVKDGATGRRYLGSFRTTAVSGQTEDSNTKRYVWNCYNRVPRPLYLIDGTDSWSYSTASFRQANNSSANQVDTVIGLAEDSITISVSGCATNSTATFVAARVGIGIGSTTVNGASWTNGSNCSSTLTGVPQAVLRGIPAIGRQFYVWLERGAGTDTQTWFGDAGSGGAVQSGMSGEVMA